MDHMQLSDEYRQQLLESCDWGKIGIAPAERIQEETEVVEEKTEAKPEAKEAKAKEEKTEDKLEEAVTHICPLCVSELSEPIEEDRILEHLNVVLSLGDRLSQLQEGEEDIESIIDETIKEILLQDTEDESTEEVE